MGQPVDDIAVRRAEPADAATILALIRELAAFEELAHEVRATEADIRRDGFGARPRFECLLADWHGAPAGFALFFHNYSTFEGRAGLYLEDIYVRPAARGRGVGRALMRALARTALERGCRRFELSVLHWNPARAFYGELGFSRMADWLPYRLSGEALARLAEEQAD